MKNYQILIGFAILSIATLVSSLILADAIKDLALHLVRVLQLQ